MAEHQSPAPERHLRLVPSLADGERHRSTPWERLHATVNDRGLLTSLTQDEEGPRLDYPALIARRTRRVTESRYGHQLPGLLTTAEIMTIAGLFSDTQRLADLQQLPTPALLERITAYEIRHTVFIWNGAVRRWDRAQGAQGGWPLVYVKEACVSWTDMNGVTHGEHPDDTHATVNALDIMSATINRMEPLGPGNADRSIPDKAVYRAALGAASLQAVQLGVGPAGLRNPDSSPPSA